MGGDDLPNTGFDRGFDTRGKSFEDMRREYNPALFNRINTREIRERMILCTRELRDLTQIR